MVGKQGQGTAYFIILFLKLYTNILPYIFICLHLLFNLIFFRSKDVTSRLRTRNNACISIPERKGSNQAFRDQLACPLCKQLFLQPFMLPCNHCICEKCIIKSKTKAEATGNYYIIICPVCNKAHCLPYTNKIQLRKNYLKAKLAKKYMRRHGILKWRFDHSVRPVYCETCRERRRVATKRCRTCGINMCSECLHLYHTESGAQDHIFTNTCQEDNEQWACLLHCNSHLSEYCLDDHKLICGFCKNSLHNDHETIPLAAACSRQAASLSNTIVKFKQGLYFNCFLRFPTPSQKRYLHIHLMSHINSLHITGGRKVNCSHCGNTKETSL